MANLVEFIGIAFMGAVALALVAGWTSTRNALNQRLKDLEFTKEYRETFVSYANSSSKPHDLYIRLQTGLYRMEQLLGTLGSGAYRSPFGIVTSQNYQFLTNTLPQMRTGTAHHQEIVFCEHVLTVKLGQLQEFIRQLDERRTSVWRTWQHGLWLVATMPARVLAWIGFADSGRMMGSSIYRALLGLVGLVGIISSIQTVYGWIMHFSI